MTLSIRDCVGEALRFVRENMRFVATMAALGAVATVLIGALALTVPAIGVLTSLATSIVQAFIYAAFTGAMLFGVAGARGRMAIDGGRLWAAMAIIGFFLGIVVFVISIPVVMTLIVGPMAAYRDQLTSAGGDQEAVMAVMLQFMEANPMAVLLTMLFYFVIWMLLTSRLYLSAPATVDQQRVLTFETWGWTKGATLRIIGARLLLLAPAYVLVFALQYLVGASLGIDPTNPADVAAAARANPIVFLIYAGLGSFLTFLIYAALEAGLSASLYRRLKPAPAPPTA